MSNCGVYKITSPTGRVYIGQSVDIIRRWKDHKTSKEKSKIQSSFKKHGFENHKFEIKEECSIELLNERERYWQDFYDVLGPNGLNLKLTKTGDKSGYSSKETKEKLAEYHKNKSVEEKVKTNKKISDSVKENFTPELKQHLSKCRKGKSISQQTKEKISSSTKGKVTSEETKSKISNSLTGRKFSEEHRRKLSDSLRGKVISKETRDKISNSMVIKLKNKKDDN